MKEARKSMTSARTIRLVFAMVIATAIALPVSAQGYRLNSAGLGKSTVSMTIPKTGNTQTVHLLQLQFNGSGANCTTGSLNDYWSPSGVQAPVGVSMGYSRSAMSLPSSSSRSVAINVSSTATPMSRQWTIVVPRGSCNGSNQTSTITLILTRAP